MTSRFIVAVPLAGIIGGPLSGYILKTFDGLHGWQWLLLAGFMILCAILALCAPGKPVNR